MPQVRTVTFSEIEHAAQKVADRWRDRPHITNVFGIPRGGCVPAALVAKHLGGLKLTDDPVLSTLIVDDLVDSGKTAKEWRGRGHHFDALFRKSWAPTDCAPDATHLGDDWLHFPWELIEQTGEVEDNVTRLLQYLGEDTTRAGLVDTPGRVVKAFVEMTQGRDADIADILSTQFEDRCDEMVIVRNVEFTSLCEHHLLPFTGAATVAYVPGDKVVGLSKLARLVDAFAQRLQVQERMTQQILAAIDEHLSSRGTGVLVRAHHSCMGCRGVRKPGAEMITSALSGFMKDDPKARAEFLGFA
jgi:GTP cyclohydrolase I